MSDITIHIDENLRSDQLSLMKSTITSEHGVTDAILSERTPHLMVVHYDHNAINSQQLLQSVCSQGYHAEVIGF